MGKKIGALVLLLLILGLVYYLFLYNPSDQEEEQVVEVIEEIIEYGYVRQDNDTKLFEDFYEEEEELNSDDWLLA